MKKAIVGAGVLIVTCALWASAANAQDNHSASFMTLQNLVFYSANDTVYPQYAGTVEVLFTAPIIWYTSTRCSTGAVAIRGTDTALISAAQTALATGRSVEIFVDDTQTVDGVVCFVRAIEY